MKKNIKFFCYCFLMLVTTSSSYAQISGNSQWSWRNGVAHSPAIRGAKGVPSKDFSPGQRFESIKFTDENGNIWLYGGENETGNGRLSDLWFYNISSEEWTWVSGTEEQFKAPIYGSFRSGSVANTPGARRNSFSWYDYSSKKLWLFGGEDYQLNLRDDLWVYDIQTGIWTWVSGSNLPNAQAFGSHVSSRSNTPGARASGISWYDYNILDPFQSYTSVLLPPRQCSKLYLSFGWHYGGQMALEGMWVFNTDDYNWILLDAEPLIFDEQKSPFMRSECTSWINTDMYGTFLYCFGGYGVDRLSNYASGNFSDLWKYDIKSNKWTYINGNKRCVAQDPQIFNEIMPYGNKPVSTINSDRSKVYVFVVDNSLWEFNLGNSLWNHMLGTGNRTGYEVFNFLYDQNPTARCGINNQNDIVSYKDNRLIAYHFGRVLSLFDPCTSNNITASRASVNDPLDSVTFTCTAVGAGPVTYLWRKHNTVASLINSPTFTTAGILPSDVYSCFVTNTAGCASNIQVVSYSNNISIVCTPPANDEPCYAIPLTVDAAPEYGNNGYATSTNDVPGRCYGATNTVWYKYSPAASGFVQFTLVGGLSRDTLNSWLGAFVTSGGSCPNLSLADSTVTTLGGCRYYYPLGGNKAATVWSSFLTAGKTYYFRISGINGDIGRYSFSLQSTNITNIASGNWHDPAIWSNNRVPTSQSNVFITFPVTVNANAICKSLTVTNGAQVTVQSNVNLTVLKQ